MFRIIIFLRQQSFIVNRFFLQTTFFKRSQIVLVLIAVSLFFILPGLSNKSEKSLDAGKKNLLQLEVSPNGRFLVNAEGDPIFLNSGTAWMIHYKLDTTEVKYYFAKRKEQKFNCVAICAFRIKDNPANIYGSEPFQRAKETNLFNPSAPVNNHEYDFWNHLDYVIDKAEEMNFYVILLPTWGTQIAGLWDGRTSSNQIFNKNNAYEYGKWIGERYRDKKHIIWMMGGDVMAVVDQDKDYREIFRTMAAGVEEGVGNSLLMSYHPRKKAPNSSEWFHNDTWLDFNSIQEWPEDQIAEIENDYQLEPVKPTWLFEGRYEDYNEDWKDWQVRYQAYQTVFAGGFGHTYGHESLIGNFSLGWKSKMDAPGAWQMQHLFKLMTSMNKEDFLNRIPNQNLIVGDQGIAERLSSSRIQATQGSDSSYAIIYSANGRNINVKMDLLSKSRMNAYWYNPRNGKWHINGSEYTSPIPFEKNIKTGAGAPDKVFDPPGYPENENDWILMLKKSA